MAKYPAVLAAMLIYLNRTGYNGLFRLNASGEFNVPPGRYNNPKIVDRPLLTLASRALSAPAVTLRHAGFDRVLEDARAGDFVYFDPPYEPLTRTANFRGYTGRGFSDEVRKALKATYRILFQSNLNVSQALARADAEVEPLPEVLHLISFIRNSERGITTA